MSTTSRVCVVAFCLLAVAVTATAAEVKPDNTWKGSVADKGLLKGTPDCVVSAKGFEKLWGDWKLAGKPPEVDFNKFILFVATTDGSQLTMSLQLSDKGDLINAGIATADFGPGFRYVIGSVPKDGIKTVNGKPLPKE